LDAPGLPRSSAKGGYFGAGAFFEIFEKSDMLKINNFFYEREN
jgi:hypothetical protein